MGTIGVLFDCVNCFFTMKPDINQSTCATANLTRANWTVSVLLFNPAGRGRRTSTTNLLLFELSSLLLCNAARVGFTGLLYDSMRLYIYNIVKGTEAI